MLESPLRLDLTSTQLLPEYAPKGPGFWKFNNTLLEDEEYVTLIRELIPQIREKYYSILDKRLLWELMKLEIRGETIKFAKRKSKIYSQREIEISNQLDQLDSIICNSDNLQNIDSVLNEYEALKTELQSIYNRKGKAAIIR